MATLSFFNPSLPFKTLTKKPTSHLTNIIKPKPIILKTSINSTKTNTIISDTPTNQTLKSRLKNNETLYGLFLLSFSPTLAEIASLSGYDFIVIDMEHGPGDNFQTLACLHALSSARTPAIIRVPESNPTFAKKALDLGPQGIMFPMIESQKMAKKAVSYCKFPPKGIRGSAHTVVRASDYGINNGYLNSYEDELLIMCQVESEEGVKKIDEIASVEGVDCVQMGPLDLSASMGYLWDPGNKKVKEMLRKAETGVLKGSGGAFLSGFAMPHDGPEEMRMRGYNMIAGAVDIGLFRNACVEDVKRFKSIAVGEDVKVDDDEKYWSE